MAHKPHKETGIFINEVSSHQRRYHKVLELTHSKCLTNSNVYTTF